MARAKVPRNLQAWFDQLAQAAGEVALERVQALMRGVNLGDLLAPPAAPAAPKRARADSPLLRACDVLGLHPSAAREVVDAAYRVLAARAHPDKQQTEARKAGAAEAFRRLTEARDVIYKARGWK